MVGCPLLYFFQRYYFSSRISPRFQSKFQKKFHLHLIRQFIDLMFQIIDLIFRILSSEYPIKPKTSLMILFDKFRVYRSFRGTTWVLELFQYLKITDKKI